MRAASTMILPALVAAGLLLKPDDPGTRGVYDDVGFCTTPAQIEEVISQAGKREKNELSKTGQRATEIKPIAAIAPHDDHLYAARVYLHAVPHVAGARTVIVIGVLHREARSVLSDPKDVIILDDFDAWNAPYGPVPVDRKLRDHIELKLKKKHRVTSREAHSKEHSIEAMLPFLQSANREVRIVPILVSEMTFEKMDKMTSALGKILTTYVTEQGLTLGDDLAILISSDAVHYGPDFEYSPFGLDEAAHEKARNQDLAIGKDLLSKTITKSKLQSFTEKVWGEKITWCGRYSIPFGLLASQKLVKYATGGKLVGLPMRYSDSYTLGVLPIVKAGIGTTAPFSLKHWVGYWSIVYGVPTG